MCNTHLNYDDDFSYYAMCIHILSYSVHLFSRIVLHNSGNIQYLRAFQHTFDFNWHIEHVRMLKRKV